MTGTRIGSQQQSAAIQDLTLKVQKLVSPGPGFSDPTQIFRVTKGVAAGNVNIAFRIAKVPGVSNVQIYRNEPTAARGNLGIPGVSVGHWYRFAVVFPNDNVPSTLYRLSVGARPIKALVP